MFSAFNHSLFAGKDDTDKERPAVALPTPVTFPDLSALSAIQPVTWSATSSPDLFTLYASVCKPSDLTLGHWRALNILLELDRTLEQLLPEDCPDGKAFVPPVEWSQPPTPSSSVRCAEQRASGPRPAAGVIVPTHRDFHIRVKELLFDNDAAFDALCQRSNGPPGQAEHVRLLHFRKFWEDLFDMAQYWDTSLDEYIPPRQEDSTNQQTVHRQTDATPTGERISLVGDSDTALPDAQPRKKARPDDEVGKGSQDRLGASRILPRQASISERPRHALCPVPTTQPHRHQSNGSYIGALSLSSPLVPEGTYKGRRISTGSSMPLDHRNDTVRDFLTPIASYFNFTVVQHSKLRKPTSLQLGKLNLEDVPVTMRVCRGARTREMARQGIVIGPAMGVSCRHETSFSSRKASPGQQVMPSANGDVDMQDCNDSTPPTTTEALDTLDIVRELSALLAIAQERHRQGKTELHPGTGKWWLDKPRWGGGPGGEKGDCPSKDDSPPRSSEKREPPNTASKPSKDQSSTAQDIQSPPLSPLDSPSIKTSYSRGSGLPIPTSKGSQPRNKQGASKGKSRKRMQWEAWKALAPPAPRWDPKMQWDAIGRPDGVGDQGWDNVYLLSSINTHVSILRLRVHAAYLDFLLTLTLPPDEILVSLPEGWDRPILSRTAWFDLFVPAERELAARGVWGVLAYLGR